MDDADLFFNLFQEGGFAELVLPNRNWTFEFGVLDTKPNFDSFPFQFSNLVMFNEVEN